MNRLASFLVVSVLVAAPSCGRTSLDTVAAGEGGAMTLGGVTGEGGTMASSSVTATGGTSAAGGAVGTGGSTSGSGGVSGRGGTPATGGHIGAGGAVSGAGGSSPDTCYSDSDCVRCIWETAPSDWNVCVGSYCCGGMVTTTAQCEANHAAWNRYCPGQVPTAESCPCVLPTCQGQAMPAVSCVGGLCGLRCPPVGGAGGVLSAGGNTGTGGSTSASGGVSGRGGSGGSSSTGAASGRVVTCTFGELLVDAQTLSSYTESGITVLATAGTWDARASFGNPAPSIQFYTSAGAPATGQVKVTAGGSVFSFVSIDLYSSMTTIPYVFTGLRGSTKVFSVSGTVPNTFGNFAPVANPNAGDQIDTLVIELTDSLAPNPMGLDNIRLAL